MGRFRGFLNRLYGSEKLMRLLVKQGGLTTGQRAAMRHQQEQPTAAEPAGELDTWEQPETGVPVMRRPDHRSAATRSRQRLRYILRLAAPCRTRRPPCRLAARCGFCRTWWTVGLGRLHAVLPWKGGASGA